MGVLLVNFESERLTVQFPLSVGSVRLVEGAEFIPKVWKEIETRLRTMQKEAYNLKPNRNHWVGHHKKPYADLIARQHPA